MPRVAALLFDLDGTLCDTAADIAASANYVRGYFAHAPLESRVVAGFVGHGLTALMQRVIADMPHVDLDESITAFRTHYGQHCVDRTQVYAGMLEALTALAAIPKAVVTNKPECFSATILRRLGLAPHFKALVGGDTCHATKPDPAPVRMALDLLRLPPNAPAALIGDGDTDIAAGRAAGLTTCAVTWGIGNRERLFAQHPHYVVQTPAELVPLFA